MSSSIVTPDIRVNHTASESDMRSLIHYLVDLLENPISLYFIVQGIRLGPSGGISKITLFVPTRSKVFIVDISRLGALAFSAPSTAGQTLKSILESDSVPKGFFDLQNASAALFTQYQISFGRIHDIRLMEVAAREGPCSREYVLGLDMCIEKDGESGAAFGWAQGLSVRQFDTRVL